MFTKIFTAQKIIFLFLVGIQLLPSDLAWAKKNKYSDTAKQAMQKDSHRKEGYFNPELLPDDPEVKEENNGSLWVDSYSSHIYDNMYRASRVGDNIMIVVDERSEGSNKGNTKSDKKMEQTNGIDNLGGLMEKLSGLISNLSPSNLIAGTTESKFKGDATTQRQGELTARLSATVTKVMRNGNMIIQGEKRIKINKEEQVLVVEGIIRPYDINPDNTVYSSAIANARISYTGFGIVAERQSPGWLVRALDYIWPF